MRWSEDSKCRTCDYDFANEEPEEAIKPNATESAPGEGFFDLELEEDS